MCIRDSSMVDDIKEYAESLYTDEEFQLRRANYSAHCMPFTKESLFYREDVYKRQPSHCRVKPCSAIRWARTSSIKWQSR